jgi:exopolyphosphatase
MIAVRLLCLAFLIPTAAMAAKTVKNFLGAAAKATRGYQGPALTLCVGNEAADADSIISSVCLAYLRGEAHIPVVSVPRQELTLRRETELLLQQVNLELSDLICLDELHPESLGCVTSVALVDHNALAPRIQSRLPASATVGEIHDHHQDSGLYTHLPQQKRQIAFDGARGVATVGSTCTLVAEQFLSSPATAQLLDASVATLLLGVIALDTSNGDPAVGKACERDFGALAALKPHAAGVDQEALYVKLRDAKMDLSFWRSLGVQQCLVLDYKQQPIPTYCHGPEVGVASVLLPLDELLAKEGAAQQLLRFMEEQHLDMLGVMTFILDPALAGPRRELLLVSPSEERIAQARRFLSSPDPHAVLQLEAVAPQPVAAADLKKSALHAAMYRQGNLKASRKQVLPLIKAFYEDIADSLEECK